MRRHWVVVLCVRAAVRLSTDALKAEETGLFLLPEESYGAACNGEETPPRATIEELPSGTGSFVIEMLDPKASPPVVFLLAFDVPPTVPSTHRTDLLEQHATWGRNREGRLGYAGPCDADRRELKSLLLRVVALKAKHLGLSAGASLEEIEMELLREAEEGGVLGVGGMWFRSLDHDTRFAI